MNRPTLYAATRLVLQEDIVIFHLPVSYYVGMIYDFACCHATEQVRWRSFRTFFRIAMAATCLLVGFAPQIYSQSITLSPVIKTVAGNGTQGFSGDGGPATGAQISGGGGVAIDSAGNFYIADVANNRVRRVDTSGIITTVAGSGLIGGPLGDGGPATSANVHSPYDVVLDGAGNLYIADTANDRVRKVDKNGIITTIAGGGDPLVLGDNGPAIKASLSVPQGLAFDGAGNLFISDFGHDRVRRVDINGIIATVAGVGVQGDTGDGGPATSAQINRPVQVGLDLAGNLYIAEEFGYRVRRVSKSGLITTVAGNGTRGFSGDGGPATNAQISLLGGMAVDSSGSYYISDGDSDRIRKVDTHGIIKTAVGNGVFGFSGDGGPPTFAEVNSPEASRLDPAGNLYFADGANYRIRKVTQTVSGPIDFGPVAIGSSTRLTVYLSINIALTLSSAQAVGDFSVLSDSCAPPAALTAGTICALQVQFAPTQPGSRTGLLTAKDGGGMYNFVLVGSGAGPVLAFTPGVITTSAGNGTLGFSGDGGPATSAEFGEPWGVALDGVGNLYIADLDNSRIRKVDSKGVVTTVAGNGTHTSSGDGGPATNAGLNLIYSVASDRAGNLYIPDYGAHRVRKVDLDGIITTVAGTGTPGYSGDGGPATSAQLDSPYGVAVDMNGNIYISDSLNYRIRKVDVNGTITTFAGNGTLGFSGDGGPAVNAQIRAAEDLALDAASQLYIADNYNHRIRKVDFGGTITTIAGDGTRGSGGDGGQATDAQLDNPESLVLDAAGDLYIADTGNSNIRKVNTSGFISTIVGNNSYGFSGDGGSAVKAQITLPQGLALSGLNNLYIADAENNRIRKVDATIGALNFGWLSLGQTSPPQSLQLTNIGTTPLNFLSLAISRNFQFASVGSDCVPTTSLVAGASCNLGVAFSPTVTGNPLTGTVDAFDNAINSPQKIALSGSSGLPVSVTVSTAPSGLNFSVDGTRFSTSQSLTWATGSPHTIASTSPQPGRFGSQYVFKSWSDGGSLSHSITAPAAATSYLATFNQSPAITSAATTTFIIGTKGSFTLAAIGSPRPAFSESGQLPGGVTLSAAGVLNGTPTAGTAGIYPIVLTASNGVVPNATQNFTLVVNLPSVTLTPSPLSFGNVAAGGGSGLLNLNATNTTSASVALNAPIINGTNASNFAVTTNSCKASLAAGASCVFGIRFAPTAAIRNTAGFTLTTGGISPGPVSLIGTGTAAFTPAAINFGFVLSGSSLTSTLTVSNKGTTPLALGAFSISGANAAEFAVKGTTCGVSLAAGASCTGNLKFTPAGLGRRTATLNLPETGPGSPQTTQQLSLVGTGTALQISPATTTFPNTRVGTASAPQQVTVKNATTAAITITGVSYTGANGGDFSTQTTSCTGTLGAGATCIVNVLFRPTVIGRRTASISIAYSGLAQTAALVGAGQ